MFIALNVYKTEIFFNESQIQSFCEKIGDSVIVTNVNNLTINFPEMFIDGNTFLNRFNMASVSIYCENIENFID